MRVTKIDPLIGRLVAFLNFNFKAGTEESLEKARLKFYDLRSHRWRSAGRKLQEEIRLDVIPLLRPEATQDVGERKTRLKVWEKWEKEQWPDQRFKDMTGGLIQAKGGYYHGPGFYLDRILEKINRLDLHYRWYAESGKYEEAAYELDLSKPLSKETGYPQPKTGTERRKPSPALRLLGPERKILTLQGEKFIVGRQFSYAESWRELLYAIIAESLEKGTFARLRMCPECSTFFWATDLKSRFCPEKRCKDAFHNRTVKDRVEKSRRRKKRRVAKAGLAMLSRLATSLQKTKAGTIADAVTKVKELASLRGIMGEKWAKFVPQIEEMIKGKNPSRVWRNLSPGIKEILANHPKSSLAANRA